MCNNPLLGSLNDCCQLQPFGAIILQYIYIYVCIYIYKEYSKSLCISNYTVATTGLLLMNLNQVSIVWVYHLVI